MKRARSRNLGKTRPKEFTTKRPFLLKYTTYSRTPYRNTGGKSKIGTSKDRGKMVDTRTIQGHWKIS
jgi:hypothetical protein